MALSKRETVGIERQLVAALTDACETAKAEIPGFEWLTHTVNYADFPQSLRITWVFDTRANKTTRWRPGWTHASANSQPRPCTMPTSHPCRCRAAFNLTPKKPAKPSTAAIGVCA